MLFVLLGLVTFAAGSVIVTTLRLGVPPMPSSNATRARVMEVLADYAHLGSVVELGSGWGGLTRRIARHYPLANVVGVERSPVPWLASVLLQLPVLPAPGTPRGPRYRLADIRKLSVCDRTVYIGYLSRPLMTGVRNAFERDMPTGGVLISAAFAMPGWTPTRTLQAGDLYRTPVYVYEF